MLDWIFEGAAKWVASIMTQLMDAVSGIFLDALGTDMTAMEEYFPFVVSAYTIIQYTAWAVLFLTVVWQLFRAFGGPLTEAENPWHLLVRGGIFAVLIAYSKPIFTMVLDIARAPYTALMDSSMDPGDFTFAGIEQALTNGLVTIVSVTTVVGLLLLIILMIALAWNYFKLLLETVERYVLVGVLCYTSPLAYSMGASKATSRVFQSWCRMVGSQLLLLVLNVWFLRAFNSSVGQFIANGGALTNGQGSIFLWLFCALALLKIAQRCDSYLAALGLSVAQTGSSMGMEMLMAARVISGFSKGGGQNASSVFNGGGRNAAGAAAGATSGTGGGIFSGFASRYKPNSFVRDAVVDGGSRMGAGGSVGFVGRAFGGMAARNGAALTADSISSVASKPAKNSGTIAGEIADRSLSAYMPQLAKGPAANMAYSNTQITGGHISTTATGPDGKQSNVELFSASQYDRPGMPHTVVDAADGSQWYQVASGEGMGAFYSTPDFTGDQSEAAQVAEAFPSAPEGTMLRQVGEGALEASYPDGGNALWYSSAHYQEPDAPHETIQGADGQTWYALSPHAATPQFDTGNEVETPAPSGFTGGADGIPVDIPSGEMPSIPNGQNLDVEPPHIPSGDGVPAIPADGPDVVGAGIPAAPPAGEGPSAIAQGGVSIGTPPDGDSGPGVPLPADGNTAIPAGSAPAIPSGSPSIPDANSSIPMGGTPVESPLTGGPAIVSSSGGGVSFSADTPPSGPAEGSLSGGVPSGGVPASGVPAGSAFGDIPSAGGTDSVSYAAGNAAAYNQALFGQFMPGFERPVVSIDSSRASDGILEVRHDDGSGTMFYDRTMYQPPKGDHQLLEDSSGGKWYAISGTPAVERRPVYQDGKPVYDKDELKTVNVETVRYKTTLTRFAEPKRRSAQERKQPKKKS